MRLFTKIIGGLFIVSTAYLLWGEGGGLSPGIRNQESGVRTVVIPPKSGLKAIADILVKEKFIPHPFGFCLVAIASGQYAQLKAGEYEIAPKTTPLDWVFLFASGKILRRAVTVPEGLTVAQVLEIVAKAPALEGEVGEAPAEGSLLPQTYDYTRGEKRTAVIQRMQKAMEKMLANLWKERDKALPLTTSQEALILASLIEKETSLDQERALVAGVFFNRLKEKMKLQSDPTVSYGLTLGKKNLWRSLTYADLKTPSPFNTYVVEGLPPTPIARPGYKSLYSVFHPEKTKAFYFVADGTGGHVFAETIEAHTRNVLKWRKIQKMLPTSPRK